MAIVNPFKQPARSGSRQFFPGKPVKFISCLIIAVAIGIGAVGLHFLDTGNNLQGYQFETTIQKQQSADEKNDVTLPIEYETETLGASDAMNKSWAMEIEQSSRAYPIWIESRHAIDGNARPYDWCVSEDIANKTDESPKGLLFVKVHKCSSSTGAGVTLRIQDGLSKRLHHPNQNQTTNMTCFAHYDHATAQELRFQERDPTQSFLWSFVREPAQRALSHFFYFYVSRNNVTDTEDSILSMLKFPTHKQPWHLQHNYQSKYLDLPSQDRQLSSSTDRIIKGYDFLGVVERMEESLVVLAMLTRIPLTDVVVYSSKVSGGYGYAKGQEGCVKLKNKWTTPKIEEYIRGEYQKANKNDYLLYNTALRSLDKTIDALGRKRVEENVELLKSLQRRNEEECAEKTTMPCPKPEGVQWIEHQRRASESCYKNDFGCGHACTDLVLADHAEKEWTRISLENLHDVSTTSALQCVDLNLNQEMDSLISRARQIFVAMPAKGGGTSMNRFTGRCGHTSESPDGLPFAFIEKDEYKDLLDKKIVMNSSSIVTSHLSSDKSLIHLANRSNEKVLIIYIHREEDKRIISGIKMIAHHMCKKKLTDREKRLYAQVVVSNNDTHCIINEKMMGKMIAQGHREVGGGSPSILTCSLFTALQLNRTQFVFLHYKQLDKLQPLLAKYHCPELLDKLPLRMNIAVDKQDNIFLYDGMGNASNKTSIEGIVRGKRLVQIEDWLEAKGQVLEESLTLLSQSNKRIAASCQKEIAQMQNKLFGCADEALKVDLPG